MSAPQIRQILGTALALRGDDIDTDRIIPARFLKVVSFEGLERHIFEDDRASASPAGTPHPFSDPRYEGASILLVGRNFGCGSSREHAPQALRRWGIRAVVGESFSEIFFGNALALGMVCARAGPSEIRTLMSLVEGAPRTQLRLDLMERRLTAGGKVADLSIPSGAREALVSGSWDGLHVLLDRPGEVAAVAERLPYLRGFR